ncbi:sugar 3,4-ketoisomerase [Planococcus sp. YIM B11945]|uniref:sugar 3,4-ketoisomerase n=1 Tax=Planococcus sp. YIM B11945 TaxID=3435410 RepID=UPI003D7E51E1
MENGLVHFDVIKDERGSLISLEQIKNIPFNLKRVYYLYDLKDSEPRGFHAHKNLRQLMVCMSGSCRVVLDDGKTKKNVVLDSPEKGLLIDSMVWREMHDFSNECVLMVMANEYYEESDYIRDYDEFRKTARGEAI